MKNLKNFLFFLQKLLNLFKLQAFSKTELHNGDVEIVGMRPTSLGYKEPHNDELSFKINSEDLEDRNIIYHGDGEVVERRPTSLERKTTVNILNGRA